MVSPESNPHQQQLVTGGGDVRGAEGEISDGGKDGGAGGGERRSEGVGDAESKGTAKEYSGVNNQRANDGGSIATTGSVDKTVSLLCTWDRS